MLKGNMMDKDILKHIGEMSTLSEVINALSAEGYSIDFNLSSQQLGVVNLLQQSPDRFLIDRSYRFEGESDPEDEAIVYAISAFDGSMKGILVDGYGTSPQGDLVHVIAQLKRRTA
jgi:hypothetical protein